MDCRICGQDTDVAVCEECEQQGFTLGTHGEILCPSCGEDFLECGCSAPDSAIM